MSSTKVAETAQGEKGSAKRKAVPHAFAEVALADPPQAWFQIQRDGDWTPGRGVVEALHADAEGLRMRSDSAMPRGTSMILNMTLPTMGSLHVRGIVLGSRREAGRGHVAAVRFMHLAEVDRQALSRHLKELSASQEQPVARPDNRRYRRFLKSVPVEYQILERNGSLQPGRGQMVTLDIGGGGIKFRVNQALSVGDLLYVRLPVADDPFFSLGRVAWTQSSRVPGRYLAGLQFVDLPAAEQNRLTHHLATEEMPTP